MAWFKVCIVESRYLEFRVEADSGEEAEQIAMDMDTPEAERDEYRERILDGTLPA